MYCSDGAMCDVMSVLMTQVSMCIITCCYVHQCNDYFTTERNVVVTKIMPQYNKGQCALIRTQQINAIAVVYRELNTGSTA